jgi:predicted aspartyl protease
MAARFARRAGKVKALAIRGFCHPPSVDLVLNFPGGGEELSSDMGMLRTTVGIEPLRSRGRVELLPDVVVDTGSELTWMPGELLERLGIEVERTRQFQLADGSLMDRDVGYAIVHAAGESAPDEVVFAQPGDASLLGARSIEGMNLRVDLVNRRLVPIGVFLAFRAA